MVIRPLTLELQEIAKNELGEEPSRVADDLDNIRKWLLTQPHLHCRTDDQWLISFLRSCKFDIEKTKIKIDDFYRMRTLMPEFYQNRDPFQPEIQEFLKAGLFLPLPMPNEASGSRIIYIHYNGISHMKINYLLLMKIYCMFIDMLILEDDHYTVAGIIVWSDGEAYPLSYLLEITPNLLRKIVYILQHCLPIQIEEVKCLNSPMGFATLINLMKSFMSKDMKKRFFFYGKKKSKELDQIIDRKYLPLQHGGLNGCTDELTEYWKNKFESYREWFLEDDNYRTKENLRPKTTTSTGIFGFMGSLNPFN